MSAQPAETLRGLLIQRKEEKLRNRWPVADFEERLLKDSPLVIKFSILSGVFARPEKRKPFGA